MADESVEMGRRIALERKRLGWSQKEFGRLVDRSETWVSQVERGVRHVDRVSVLERVADVFGISIGDLSPDVAVGAVAERPQVAGDISLVLTSSDALRGVVTRADKIDLPGMTGRAKQAWKHAHGAEYDELSRLLSGAIPEMEVAARSTSGADQKSLFTTLAKTYHAVAAVLAEVGETGAAWVAADRAIAAAEHAGDPLLMGEGAFRLTLVFQAARWLDMAQRTAETAADALLHLRQSGKAEAISVWGALKLQLAVIAARMNRAEDAYAHLEAAATAAGELGSDRNDYDTEFGPTNVELHEVAVAVELGDAGRALRVGEIIGADGLSAERRTRLLIDLARAHAQRRNVDGAVECLRRAASLAPEQVRSHPLVRDVLGDLALDGLGHPALRALTAELGIQTD